MVTDEGLWGIGEATLNAFGRTCEAAVHEIGDLVVGSDPRQVRNVVGQLYERVSNEGGHVHRTAIAGIAVSYTHLDVYKRQVFARPPEMPIRFCSAMPTWKKRSGKA